jgi:hypothetical protein
LADAARDPGGLDAWHHARLLFADWLEERGRPEAWAARARWSAQEEAPEPGWWQGRACQEVTTQWHVETLWPAALWDACERQPDRRFRSGFRPCPAFVYRLAGLPNGRPLLHFPPGTLTFYLGAFEARPYREPAVVRMNWRLVTNARDGELVLGRAYWWPAEGAHPLGLLALFPENHRNALDVP